MFCCEACRVSLLVDWSRVSHCVSFSSHCKQQHETTSLHVNNGRRSAAKKMSWNEPIRGGLGDLDLDRWSTKFVSGEKVRASFRASTNFKSGADALVLTATLSASSTASCFDNGCLMFDPQRRSERSANVTLCAEVSCGFMCCLGTNHR